MSNVVNMPDAGKTAKTPAPAPAPKIKTAPVAITTTATARANVRTSWKTAGTDVLTFAGAGLKPGDNMTVAPLGKSCPVGSIKIAGKPNGLFAYVSATLTVYGVNRLTANVLHENHGRTGVWDVRTVRELVNTANAPKNGAGASTAKTGVKPATVRHTVKTDGTVTTSPVVPAIATA